MKPLPSMSRAFTLCAVLVAQLFAFAQPLFAQGVSPSAADVKQGQEYYEQGRFDEAIQLLKSLVDRGVLNGQDLIKARELLARSYAKKGYPDNAKETFKVILHDDPTWTPDPIRVPPDETALFEDAKREHQAQKTAEQPGSATTPAPPPKEAPPATVNSPRPMSVPPPQSEAGVKKSPFKQWCFWAIGAGVAGAAVAVAASGSGSPSPTDPDLPGFPSHP